MSSPIVFVSRNRIKEGMLAAFQEHYRGSLPLTEAGKPGTHVQLAYLNEETAEVNIIRVFPSAEALDLQLQGADERSRTTYQFIEPVSIEILGTPNPYALEMMKKVSGSGIAVSITPSFIGGFIRPKPG